MRPYLEHQAADRAAANRRLARGVENLAVVASIAVVLVWMTQAGVAALRAGTLTEVLVSFRSLQIDSVEQFALSGRWLETGARGAQGDGGEPPDSRRSEADEVGREFRRSSAAVTTTSVVGGAASAASATNVLASVTPMGGVKAVRYGVLDGTLVAVGRFGERGDTFSWAIRPAALATSTPTVVVWLCDTGMPDPRWSTTPLLDWPDLRAGSWCRAGDLR